MPVIKTKIESLYEGLIIGCHRKLYYTTVYGNNVFQFAKFWVQFWVMDKVQEVVFLHSCSPMDKVQEVVFFQFGN
jgi:hypothetical protein